LGKQATQKETDNTMVSLEADITEQVGRGHHPGVRVGTTSKPRNSLFVERVKFEEERGIQHHRKLNEKLQRKRTRKMKGSEIK